MFEITTAAASCCSRATPPTCCCWKSASAGGSTPPTSSTSRSRRVDHADLDGPHRIFSATRWRRSRPRRPASSSAACRRSSRRNRDAARRDRAAGRAGARAVADRRRALDRDTTSTAGWSIRTTTACSICRCPSSPAAISSRTPASPSRRLRAVRHFRLAAAGLRGRHRQGRVAGAAAAAQRRQAHGADAAGQRALARRRPQSPTAAAPSPRRSAISRSGCRARWC